MNKQRYRLHIRSVTIDLLNDKALNLLENLETVQIIRLHKVQTSDAQLSAKYKGKMTQQTRDEIDSQLNELRK